MDITAELLDEVTGLICAGLRTSDPAMVAAVSSVQRSYFASMSGEGLLFIKDLLLGYSVDEKKACSQLLLVIERELNDTYVTWLRSGGAESCVTPPHIVRNAVYVIPTLLALSLPILIPVGMGTPGGVRTVMESTPESPLEVLAGTIIAEELAGRTGLGYEGEHLRWISSKRDALLPYADHFRKAGSVDRAFYESLVTSHSAITDGVL